MTRKRKKKTKIDSTIAERFLWLGVAALAVAGLFAITLVVGRTPQLASLGVMQQLFSVALVVHVDLSVLVWFLCVGSMGWSLLVARLPKNEQWPYWQQGAWLLMALATVFIAVSPLNGEWEVIKSNYIPVLDNKMFLMALSLLAGGLAVSLVQLLVGYAHHARRRALSYIDLGWIYAAFATALALVAFYLSKDAMLACPDALTEGCDAALSPAARFEQFFWAGGHLLQFGYCGLMMAGWLMLLKELSGKDEKSFCAFIAYAVLAAGSIVSFAGFAIFGADAEKFSYHQTRVMIELLGLGPILMALIVVPRMWKLPKRTERNAYHSALAMSLLLFFAGGLLGLFIRGQNVTIPAHYHGEIVGVTLALMGVAYAMLPAFGYKSVQGTKLAFWQPIVYGVGQLMHIGGLAYSGGYGVLRKTADAATELAPNIKIAMGIMGLGGLLAIIGGLLFVVVMAKAWLLKRRAKQV